jgi:hypothetical protein
MRSWIELIAVISIVGIVIYWAEYTSRNDNVTKKTNKKKNSKHVTDAAATTSTTTATTTTTTTISPNVSSSDESDAKPPLRMITKEELACHNGTAEANYSMWLSIFSEVYDVSSAPQYYAPNATYNIFTGREGNVPFVTGIFTEEEAAKSITTLSYNQQWIVEHFANDTYKNNKQANYTFVGYLIGELYHEDGTPTETLMNVRHNISLATEERRLQEVKRQKILAERRRKEAEQKAAGIEPPPPPKVVIINNNNNSKNNNENVQKQDSQQNQEQQQQKEETIKATEL